MKNLGGAIVAIFGVSIIMDIVYNLSTIEYGTVPRLISILLATASNLLGKGIEPNMLNSIIENLSMWLVAGLFLGVLATPGWNTVRSALWYGAILAILDTMSTLITNPNFWDIPDRNIQLFIIFISGLVLAQTTLLSAVPIALSIQKMKAGENKPIPEKIETICVCGATFKSRPLLCSECGRPLEEQI